MRSLWKNKKSAVILTALFLVVMAAYILSDAVLQQNTVQISNKPGETGEFGQLVDWLPKDAKLAIEYRAKYLFYQNRMNKAKDPDAKVHAIFTFADYIKQKDPKGSDTMLAGVVTLPKFNRSRKAYFSYARLLLNKDSSHPVSVKELHDYMATLKWPEDDFDAWGQIMSRLYAMRASDEEVVEVLSPLLDKQREFSNYERFYAELEKRARKLELADVEKKAAAGKNYLKTKKFWFPQALLKAPLEYRIRYSELKEDIAKTDNPDELVPLLNSLGVLTRDEDDVESNAIFDRLLDEPALRNNKYAYMTLANLLMYNRSKRQVSIPQYLFEVQKMTDPREKYMALEAGFSQLRTLKVKPKDMLEYLSPLLDQDIKYQDYAGMFRELATQAQAVGDTEKAAKANAFLTKVQETYMPSLMEDFGFEDESGEERSK